MFNAIVGTVERAGSPLCVGHVEMVVECRSDSETEGTDWCAMQSWVRQSRQDLQCVVVGECRLDPETEGTAEQAGCLPCVGRVHCVVHTAPECFMRQQLHGDGLLPMGAA